MRARARHLACGGLAMLAVGLGVASLSDAPSWRSLPEGTALLRLSFTHSGNRSASCRTRSTQELAALPANMRQVKVCSRRRPSVYVELDVDRKTVFTADLHPAGLAGSGPSRVYKRILLPAGVHDVAVRIRDRPNTKAFDYTAAKQLRMAPTQSVVIDFLPDQGGIVFR